MRERPSSPWSSFARSPPVPRAVPCVDVPVRQPALERVRLDKVRRGLLLALLQVVDLDQATLVGAAAQGRDEILLGALDVGLGGLDELELAEGLLELRTDALQRRAGI